MIGRLLATAFAITFVAFVDRASAAAKPRRRGRAATTICVLLLTGALAPLAAFTD